MNRDSMKRHIDELVANPRRWFDTPRAVLGEPGLTDDERRRILESWKQDSQQLADATDENMSGGEETQLREVAKILGELDSADQKT